MTTLLLVAIGVSLPLSAVSQVSRPASIGGVVVDVATNAPTANAEVELIRRIQRGNLIEREVSTTVTDGDGAFLFSAVEPGQYGLNARLDGHVDVTEDYVGRTTRSVAIASGQSVTGLTLRLGRDGVIAGTVLDLERQAVANSPVSALRYQYDTLGQAWRWELLQFATANEQG